MSMGASPTSCRSSLVFNKALCWACCCLCAIYINDIATVIFSDSEIDIFADDIALTVSHNQNENGSCAFAE